MSFADPQSVTINAVPTNYPRTSSNGTTGVFALPDGSRKLTVSHQYGKRTRRTVRLDDLKLASDPLIPANNVKNSMSVYMVVDLPANGGYTVAEAKLIVDGLVAYLMASSGARVTQLLGGEN